VRAGVCVCVSLSVSAVRVCKRERESLCTRTNVCVQTCLYGGGHTIHGKHVEIMNRRKEARRSVCTHITSCHVFIQGSFANNRSRLQTYMALLQIYLALLRIHLALLRTCRLF